MGSLHQFPPPHLKPLPSTIPSVQKDPTHPFADSSRKFWGILTRKEHWHLSFRGWLLITSIGLVAGYFGFANLHSFLAVTHRVNANFLVVEGWIQRYAFRAAADEFNGGRYERIFTTGGPENGSGGYTNDYQTSASAAEEALKKLGIADDLIQMAPSHVSGRERTYSSAVALREWFRDHNITVQSINVLTEDCHARRTRLLYQEAFGKNIKVGIINVANPDYDPNYWWRYSDGVREVIGESIAYVYARFFFYPEASQSDTKMTRVSQSTPVAQQ